MPRHLDERVEPSRREGVHVTDAQHTLHEVERLGGYAGVDDDRMRYAASLAKIAIMLTVFEQVERGNLEYTPTLTHQLEGMIRRSENRTASTLIKLVGFDTIERTLRDPRYELYTRKRGGGLWVGKGYGGLGVWRRDPLHQISHGATARQVARFLIMLEQETLVSPWASREMKRIMGNPELDHKFVEGLADQPRATIYRKGRIGTPTPTPRSWSTTARRMSRSRYCNHPGGAACCRS